MKSIYLAKKTGGYLLAFFLLFGVAMISSTTAQAQYPGGWGRQDRNRGYGGYGGNGNTYQIAQQQGYSDGLNTGSADGQRGQSYDPQRSHYYKSGTDGYNSRFGNKGAYQQAFRQGFLQGYREGYQRYGNNRGRNNGRNNNGRWNNGRWFPW
jgi:hypothetical protein